MTGKMTDAGFRGFQHLAWSPDGSTIAVTVAPLRAPFRSAILFIDLASGQSNPLMRSKDRLYQDLKWTSDGRGLYVLFSNRNTGFDRRQIGYFSYPGGEFREVTRDANFYQGLSLSADGRTIATVQRKTFRSFFLLPINGAGLVQSAPLLQTENDYRFQTFAGDGEMYVAAPGKLLRVTLDGQHTTDVLTDPNGYFLRPEVCWDQGSAQGARQNRAT